MQFNFIWDSSVANAPAGFKAGMVAAGEQLASYFSNNIVLNISVGWGEDGDIPIPSTAAATGNFRYSNTLSYQQFVSALSKCATSGDDQLSATFLKQAADPTVGKTLYVAPAELKALGLLNPQASGLDGDIGFSAGENWNFSDTSGTNSYDFLGVSFHELTHAMGRVAYQDPYEVPPESLFQFAATGSLGVASSGASYISNDGGVTSLGSVRSADMDGDLAAGLADPFASEAPAGVIYPITAADLRIMDTLGYTLSAAGNQIAHTIASAKPGDKIIGTANDDFIFANAPNQTVNGGAGNDHITGGSSYQDGASYSINGQAYVYSAANGHFYEIVNLNSAGATWAQAAAAASSSIVFGVKGHLATITSAAEETFIENALLNLGYDGGSLTAKSYTETYIGLSKTNGVWGWVTNEGLTYTNWASNLSTGASSTAGLIVNGGSGFSTVWQATNPNSNGYQSVQGIQVLAAIEFDTPTNAPYVGVSNYSAIYSGQVNQYTINNVAGVITVADNVTARDGTDTLSNIQHIQFADCSINTTMKSEATKLPVATVNSLVELYVAYFARTPDATGLSYWIDKAAVGESLSNISTEFYNAGVQYSSVTGYSATMSNTDFIKLVYANVLDRTGASAPPAADVAYWNNQIQSGGTTTEGLIQTMLAAAHGFANDPTWGWVPQLLNNKITVGYQAAVSDGLDYNSPTDAITKGMAIAQAVMPTDITAAVALIGVAGTVNV